MAVVTQDDDQQTEQEATPVKRKPGRPKKKRVNAIREPMHEPADAAAGERLENFEYHPYEAHDALHIDPDIVRGIRDEWGYALLWVVHECSGKAFPDLVNARRRNGFAEVKAENFGGALRHMADKDGRIHKEGLVLMARPVEIEAKAKAYDKKMAKDAVTQMRRAHADEGVPVSMPDGNAEVARKRNRHRSSFEPLEIPD